MAKHSWSKEATSNFNLVTVELDQLLEVVAAIAGEVKKEADASLRVATMALIAVSLALALLVLTIPVKAVSLRERV